jgi:hypothetical protein
MKNNFSIQKSWKLNIKKDNREMNGKIKMREKLK